MSRPPGEHLMISRQQSVNDRKAPLTIWLSVGDQLAIGWRPISDRLTINWRSVGDQLAIGWQSIGDQWAINWQSFWSVFGN